MVKTPHLPSLVNRIAFAALLVSACLFAACQPIVPPQASDETPLVNVDDVYSYYIAPEGEEPRIYGITIPVIRRR